MPVSDDYSHRVEVVTTGHPPAQFIACRACGVLLWDIKAHWAHAHAELEARNPYRREAPR